MAVHLGHHIFLTADALGDAGEELQLVVIAEPFTAREVRQKDWTGLGTQDAVHNALAILAPLHDTSCYSGIANIDAGLFSPECALACRPERVRICCGRYPIHIDKNPFTPSP